jgi:hypothetical protein
MTLLLTGIALIFNPSDGERLAMLFLTILTQALPYLLFFYAISFIVDILLKPVQRKQILNEKGDERWYLAVLCGIFSREAVKEVPPGMQRTFTLALVLQLGSLPLLIRYFGWGWSGLFSLLLIVAAILQGRLIEFVLANHKKDKHH